MGVVNRVCSTNAAHADAMCPTSRTTRERAVSYTSKHVTWPENFLECDLQILAYVNMETSFSGRRWTVPAARSNNWHRCFFLQREPARRNERLRNKKRNTALPLTSGSSRRAPKPSKAAALSALFARTARSSGVSRCRFRMFTLPRRGGFKRKEKVRVEGGQAIRDAQFRFNNSNRYVLFAVP